MNTKVIITAEDQTGAGIASVKSSMAGLGVAIGAVSSVTTKLIDMLGEVATRTIRLYKEQINLADSMDEMSVRMGMSIKDLSAWKAAAEMNGASIEAMSSGTRMLAKHMVEHGDALRKAGIDTKDTNKAFDQLSDLFKGMTDPVARLDLATRLFGRGLGQQLLPVLVQGSEGMATIRETTDRYGEALTLLSPEAQKLNDTLYLMGINFKQAAAEGVFPLVKAFNDEMLPALREVAKEGSLLKTLWVGFGGAMKIGFADPWSQTLAGAKATLQQFMADVETLLAKITFGKVSELHMREAQRMSDAAKKTLAEAAGNSPKSPAPPPALMLPGANTDAEAAALAASLRNKNGKGKAAAKTPLQKMIELGERNLAAAKAAEYVAVDDDEEARLGAHKRQMESLRLEDKEADALETMRKKYVEMADPLQKYRDELDQINMLRANGKLTADQALQAEWHVGEAMDAAAKKMAGMGEAMKENSTFAHDMGMSFSSAFEDAALSGKKLWDVVQGLGKDLAKIIFRKSITEPLGEAVSGAIKSSGIGGSIGGWFKGLFNADGNVFSSGDLHRHVNSIVSRPTLFRFAQGGSFGVMGEAGPEAIMPLKRGPDGSLGVRAAGGAPVTHNNFSVDMRGASVEAVARLERLVVSVNGSIERRAMSVMGQARMRGA